MANASPELLAHREWLGQIQQVGLVVSPLVLVKQGVFADRQRGIEKQARLRELAEGPLDFPALAREILEWPDGVLAGGPEGPALPPSLTVALPNHEDCLSPTYAVIAPREAGGHDQTADAFLCLVSVVANEADLDRPPAEHTGWRASPHARLERLLRETGIPIGLLFNGVSLRLIHAPRSETAGHLTFRLSHLLETLGRPMVSGLFALLGAARVTDIAVEEQRLPALLRESRRYQNEVSTALAGQVLEALWQLLRGFQRADSDSKGELLRRALGDDPHEVYGGLLSTLMRLVFILYAEDRGLMPQGDVYQRYYSVSGLFERLREDQARYPDTMDARYGAWAQLLALFRLIHDGGGHGDLRFPPRHGRLFDPDAYPFLEGRPAGSARQLGEVVEAPRVPDGTAFRVLQNLLVLDGERLSYRALDVEQIGSVYEAMMGFALETATGPSIAVTPKHVVVNLEELLEQKGKERSAWLKERAELKLSSDALARADTVPDIVAALGSRVSRYTPHVLMPGAMYLQPTEERRRSGSHYTPRSLTEPIVRTTLRPILERLGDRPTPGQILDLKVCDPAMGSGAFLVETCRLLGERLAKAWEDHGGGPPIPDDEDSLTLARRMVAERCLYGVDKNIFAVDLAKLSLWLATLAREHPFTFLDHALRHGDSLVGLSREQISCLHWTPSKQLPLIRSFLEPRVAEAQRLRERIQAMATSDDVPEKARLLRDAEEAIDEVRVIGDAVVSAFFERDKARDRETLRTAYAGQIDGWLSKGEGAGMAAASLRSVRAALRSGARPIPAFHWEIEFPEVFTRENPGFDAFVGNPPFLGGTMISTAYGVSYRDFISGAVPGSGGRCDLVAYFFRRAFDLLSPRGTSLGLIATKTIAQGDTRRGGLTELLKRGGRIYAAIPAMDWPGAAAVRVAIIHVSRGLEHKTVRLFERECEWVNPFLLPSTANDDPKALSRAIDFFMGSKIYGQAFLFADGDDAANPVNLMHEILDREPSSAAFVREYIGGTEVNGCSRPRRWVIDFGELSEDEARRHRGLWSIVSTRVKDSRALAPKQVRETPFWWFFNRRTEHYARCRQLDRVLVRSAVSEYHAFRWHSPHAVFSHNVVVFVESQDAAFGLLQSRLHEVWVDLTSSSLEDRQGYRPSDSAETFPLPVDWLGCARLREVAEDYSRQRQALMVGTREGLTSVYNRFHDPDERHPDVLRLRELHDAMDRAVLDAYGWTDIRPACEFLLDYEDDEDETPGKASRRRKPWRYRWPDEVRDEVLGRLLKLNAERAEEERVARESTVREAAVAPRKKSKTRRSGSLPLLSVERESGQQ